MLEALSEGDRALIFTQFAEVATQALSGTDCVEKCCFLYGTSKNNEK